MSNRVVSCLEVFSNLMASDLNISHLPKSFHSLLAFQQGGGKKTPFAEVVEGMDVVRLVEKEGSSNGKPGSPRG